MFPGVPNTTAVMQDFKMKPGSIDNPDIYLGVTIKQMRLANGVMAWASSPSKYVRTLVDAVIEVPHKFRGQEMEYTQEVS